MLCCSSNLWKVRNIIADNFAELRYKTHIMTWIDVRGYMCRWWVSAYVILITMKTKVQEMYLSREILGFCSSTNLVRVGREALWAGVAQVVEYFDSIGHWGSIPGGRDKSFFSLCRVRTSPESHPIPCERCTKDDRLVRLFPTQAHLVQRSRSVNDVATGLRPLVLILNQVNPDCILTRCFHIGARLPNSFFARVGDKLCVR